MLYTLIYGSNEENVECRCLQGSVTAGSQASRVCLQDRPLSTQPATVEKRSYAQSGANRIPARAFPPHSFALSGYPNDPCEGPKFSFYSVSEGLVRACLDLLPWSCEAGYGKQRGPGSQSQRGQGIKAVLPVTSLG